MKYKQISVFLENRAGRLADMTTVLADKNVDIKTISIADTNNFGIVRLIVDNPDTAVSALKEADFIVKENTVVGLVIDDKAGGLKTALRTMEDNDIFIEYVYKLESENGKTTIIAKFENQDKAVEILNRNGLIK